MKSRIDTLLDELTSACREVALSRGNWEHLYLIAVFVHGQRGTINILDIRKLLVDRGCSIHKAGFLCRQLETFCQLLRVYDEERSKGAPS
jgi:hypothetical protein